MTVCTEQVVLHVALRRQIDVWASNVPSAEYPASFPCDNSSSSKRNVKPLARLFGRAAHLHSS